MDYFLVDNLLTPDPKDRVAIVTAVKTHTEDDIVKRMKLRGNLLTETDIRAVVFAYQDELGLIVEEGGGINTKLFNAQPSITGKFDDSIDSFDATRHKVRYNINFSKTVREKIAKIKTHKVAAPTTGPVIAQIKDSVSGLNDGTLSAGGTLEIFGTRLKVLTEVDSNGVFFIAADGTEYQVATLSENKPSKLIVIIPPLPAGTYKLEVRTNYIVTKDPGKQLRKVQFDAPLNM